jgi:hypothetical protein
VFLFGFNTYCTIAASDDDHVVVLAFEVSVPEEHNFNRERASIRT